MGEPETYYDVLERWHDRFHRVISVYDETFAKEGFDDLVVTVITAAYIEGLLYVGVQFSGYPMKLSERKTLGDLLKEAEARGTVSPDLASILRVFGRIRNRFAHDLDYRLEMSEVERIYNLLPKANRDALERAFAHILSEPSDGLKTRLVFDQIVSLTIAAVGEAHRRTSGSDDGEP